MLSLGSMEIDHVIGGPCYNEVIYKTYSKIIILGAMKWPCYIENCTLMRHILMRLNRTVIKFYFFQGLRSPLRLSSHCTVKVVVHRLSTYKSTTDVNASSVQYRTKVSLTFL